MRFGSAVVLDCGVMKPWLDQTNRTCPASNTGNHKLLLHVCNISYQACHVRMNLVSRPQDKARSSLSITKSVYHYGHAFMVEVLLENACHLSRLIPVQF